MSKKGDKSNIKKLRSDREMIVSQLNRFKDFIINCDSSTDILSVKSRFVKCESLWDQYHSIHSELEFLEPDPQSNAINEFEESYFEVCSRFETFINNNSMPDNVKISLSPKPQSSVSNVKLPTLDLPTFTGKYEAWLTFFDTFVSLIHNNTELSDIQKFYYLQSCLKGEASQVIHSIEVTESNYADAFKLLRERYENTRLIIQSHVRNLFDLSPINKDSHYELRKLIDSVSKNLRALKTLKEKVEHWDTLLIYLISTKLDPSSRREWETYSIKNNIVQYEEFIKFLTNRCHVLESVDSLKVNKNQSNNNFTKPYDRQRIGHTKSFLSQEGNVRGNCPICNNDKHPVYYCSKFLAMNENQRIAEIKGLHLCLNCFNKNHMSMNCKLSGCKKCGKPHNTLLHLNFPRFNKNDTALVNTSVTNKNASMNNAHKDSQEVCPNKNELVTSVNTHSANNLISSEVLLSTAKVLISSNNGTPVEARALLDCGSQSNFISSALLSRLNSPLNEVNMSVVGINGSVSSSTKYVKGTIKSKYNSYGKVLDFFVLNTISEKLPIVEINKDALKLPNNLYLADDTFHTPGPIDMLLGANVFYELLLVGQMRIGKNMPIMQKTQLGWIISGSVPMNNNHENKQSSQTVCKFSCNSKSNVDIQQQLERFWHLEEVKSNKLFNKEEQECENLFLNTTNRDNNGKFIVELPVREGIENMGESKEIAIKRFHKLEKRLSCNEHIKKQYVEFMNEYEALGHMSVISESEIDSDKTCYYLPHHPVFKESSTTKLRVVFNASSSTDTGMSLNDYLKTGPIIQDDLYAILIRFRKHNCVLGADVEKMYRQVWVKSDQRDLQRIVWRSNPDDELRHYRLNTVTYGTAPASFLAIRCLHKIAEDNIINNPTISSEIIKNFYVDDYLSGAETVEQAMALKNDISEILSGYGFILRKWFSNKREIFQDDKDEVEIKQYVIDETITKTLGLTWNTESDSLQYTVHLENNLKATKRNILSIVSKVFDPLGLIGPIIIRAKILLQKLWSEKLDWDDRISQDLFEMWITFYNELPFLNNVTIPRHVIIPEAKSIELHGFCDASEKAYGACIYVRSRNSEGIVTCRLLCAKSKVAPMKTITLPRLELCAALLLSRLMRKTINSLILSIVGVNYWSDSRIVLAWLQAEPSSWGIFVSHRVAEIQENSRIDNWNHVTSKENPADLLSRGCSTMDFVDNTFWWNGPHWLSQNEEMWPRTDIVCNDFEIPERRAQKQSFTVTMNDNIFSKYSTLFRLQRIIAHCLRFYKNITCDKFNKKLDCLSVGEIHESMICLIKLAQSCTFASEIKALQSEKPIPKNSKLLSLNPFLDDIGILRVGGRLQKSNISYDQKHPILLDKGHAFTDLIIKNEHRKNLHMGPQNLLANLRAKFWILGGICEIKKVLRKCIVCFKVNPKGINALMGELPGERLAPTKPFFNTGVDYAGPFEIKTSKLRKCKIVKAYLCIFICLVTKAIHLEAVSDLTTDAFLNALKRFISRRGKCQTIFSDCGTNFVGAKNQMNDFSNLLKSNDFKNSVTQFLSEDAINWKFIPPRSPHFGGIWESNVKQAKYHLKRVVGNNVLTFEELSTVFCQVEACMNSRPLSPLSNDPTDLSPLTPGHFLIGESLLALPEPDIKDLNCSRLNRYQLMQQIVQRFWERWHKECICELNKRTKWKSQGDRNIKVGDMVLLKDENLPPLKWPLGRIRDVFPGTDGIVRVVLIKTSNGLVKRGITKVCILPLE